MELSIVKSTNEPKGVSLRLITTPAELPPSPLTSSYLITGTLATGLALTPAQSPGQGSRLCTLPNGGYRLHAPITAFGDLPYTTCMRHKVTTYIDATGACRLPIITPSDLTYRAPKRRRSATPPTPKPSVVRDHLAELKLCIKDTNISFAALAATLPSLTLAITPEGKLVATYTKEHTI